MPLLSSKGLNKDETGVNWRKVKAEYLAGGISQRALAEKYGIPWGTFKRKAQLEHWGKKRKEAEDKAVTRAVQKTSDAVVDNAVLLERVKTGLLQRLAKMVEEYPDTNVAEMRKKKDGALLIYRMKDIAAVYAALEEKTAKVSVDVEDLSPLVELLRDE